MHAYTYTHANHTHSRPFTPAEIEAAQAAFSNLIGGVGYFQGRTSIKAGDEEAGAVLQVGGWIDRSADRLTELPMA